MLATVIVVSSFPTTTGSDNFSLSFIVFKLQKNKNQKHVEYRKI